MDVVASLVLIICPKISGSSDIRNRNMSKTALHSDNYRQTLWVNSDRENEIQCNCHKHNLHFDGFHKHLSSNEIVFSIFLVVKQLKVHLVAA